MNIIIIFMTVFCLCQTNAEKRLRMTIKESNIWSDNKILNYTQIIDEAEPSLSFEFKVKKTIPDVDIHIEANVKHKDNNKYYGQFNGTYSICRIMAYKNASPLAQLMYNHLKSYGNIPDDCPIKDDTYGIKKIWFGDHGINLNLPELEIEAHIQAYVVDKDQMTKILDNTYKAEAIYKEVTGQIKRAGGLLSMLG